MIVHRRKICNCRPLAARGCNVTNSLRLAWARRTALFVYASQLMLDFRYGSEAQSSGILATTDMLERYPISYPNVTS